MDRTSLCALGVFAPIVFAAGSASAAKIADVHTEPGFESAGVVVTLEGDDGNEKVSVELAEHPAGSFETAHSGVRFSEHGFATSLFDLTPRTQYRVRVKLDDPDGVQGENPVTEALQTKQTYQRPSPRKEVYVSANNGTDSSSSGSRNSPYATIQYALDQAKPYTEIRVMAGTYGPVEASRVNPPADKPIVIRADDPTNKPVIDATGNQYALLVSRSAHLHFDGLVLKNADAFNVRFNGSSHIVLSNSKIQDAGRYNVLINKAYRYPDGIEKAGRHLLERNEILENDSGDCQKSSNSACPNQTYYGIKFDDRPSAGTVIRQNAIRGHVDNASLCGDEGNGEGRSLKPGSTVLVRNGGMWNNHDLAFYDNRLDDARDDNVEMDGICINARIFRNRIGGATNVFSIAPALPGPFFYVRNVVDAEWEQSVVKMNTNGEPDVPLRNHFFYHNTVVRQNKGHMLNLWYAHPSQHNVPVDNIRFRNNVFLSRMGGRLLDEVNQGQTHPSFDYDLWYASVSTKPKFEWRNGSQSNSYDTLKAFRMGTGQEEHGIWGDPQLDGMLHPKMASPVIDAAMRIPGINDDFSGAAPDIGAFERQTIPSMDDAGDASVADAATSDGGPSGDASPAPDSSSNDAAADDANGVATDSGASTSGKSDGKGGCSCRAANRSPMPTSFLLVLVGCAAFVGARRFEGSARR